MTAYASHCSLCDHEIKDGLDACQEHPFAGRYMVQRESQEGATAVPVPLPVPDSVVVPSCGSDDPVLAAAELFGVFAPTGAFLAAYVNEFKAETTAKALGYNVVPFGRSR